MSKSNSVFFKPHYEATVHGGNTRTVVAARQKDGYKAQTLVDTMKLGLPIKEAEELAEIIAKAMNQALKKTRKKKQSLFDKENEFPIEDHSL